MIRDPFGKEELYRAWMKCRYFNFHEISKYKIQTEIEFYDKYINEIVLDLYSNLKSKKFRFYEKQIFLMPKSSGLLRRNTFIAVQDQIVSHAILDFIGKKSIQSSIIGAVQIDFLGRVANIKLKLIFHI